MVLTLHEAIVCVLYNTGESLTTQEIADRINAEGLYSRPVPAGQVSARINKYPHLFTKDRSVRPMRIGLPGRQR